MFFSYKLQVTASSSMVVSDLVQSRCKQWMASADYNLSTLLYPRQVGLQLMPVGLPQGAVRSFFSVQSTKKHMDYC